MKVFVHAGLHRAASTSLQTWISANKSSWTAQKCTAFAGLSGGGEASPANLLVGGSLRAIGPAAVADVLANDFSARETDTDTVVLSDENMLGRLPGSGSRAFNAAAPLAKTLARLATCHMVIPVIILREHVDWLVSLYSVAQARCETRSFRDFAAEVLPGPAAFRPLLRNLAEACRPSLPLVATLDSIATDGGNALIRELAAAFGVRIEPGAVLPRSNPSPPPLFCTLRQEAARHGGFLLMEKNRPMLEMIKRMAREPDSAGDHSALVELIRDNTLPMPAHPRFKARLAMAQARLGREGAQCHLGRSDATAILEAALATAARPVVSHDDEYSLRALFSADRKWVARHHAPQWAKYG